MNAERGLVATSVWDKGFCTQMAGVHRVLGRIQTDQAIADSHIRWAEALEARAGKGPENAEPGDPCGLLMEAQPVDRPRPISRICNGTLQCYIDVLGTPLDCACHIDPPCGACIEAPLVCDTCRETVP